MADRPAAPRRAAAMSAADMLRARGKLGPYLPKAETVEPPTETDPPKPRKRAPRTG